MSFPNQSHWSLNSFCIYIVSLKLMQIYWPKNGQHKTGSTLKDPLGRIAYIQRAKQQVLQICKPWKDYMKNQPKSV